MAETPRGALARRPNTSWKAASRTRARSACGRRRRRAARKRATRAWRAVGAPWRRSSPRGAAAAARAGPRQESQAFCCTSETAILESPPPASGSPPAPTLRIVGRTGWLRWEHRADRVRNCGKIHPDLGAPEARGKMRPRWELPERGKTRLHFAHRAGHDRELGPQAGCGQCTDLGLRVALSRCWPAAAGSELDSCLGWLLGTGPAQREVGRCRP